MNKKTTIIAGTILLVFAVFFGFVLVNKGDGPIMGVILSNDPIRDSLEYEQTRSMPSEGVVCIVEKEFDTFKTKYSKSVSAGKDLYVAVSVTECPKGTKFRAKLMKDSLVIKEESKVLQTDQKGLVLFTLEAEKVSKGNYMLEVYVEDQKGFDLDFEIQ